MRLTSALPRLLILAMVLTLLPPTPVRTAVNQDDKESATTEKGLRFRLSEGSATTEKPRPNPVVAISALSEKETQDLLARLPAARTEPGEIQDFKLREGSLPPPRTGATIPAAFVSPAPRAPQPPATTTAPLEVSRYAPEGEVALVPA